MNRNLAETRNLKLHNAIRYNVGMKFEQSSLFLAPFGSGSVVPFPAVCWATGKVTLIDDAAMICVTYRGVYSNAIIVYVYCIKWA
jgi:hypothetical protein